MLYDNFLLFRCCSFSSAVSGAFSSSMPSGSFMQIFLRSRSVLTQVRFRVGDLVLFRSVPNDQQWRFAGSKLDVVNLSNFAVLVEDRTSYEIADIGPTGLKVRSLGLWNLQLATDKRFSVRNRVNRREFQNQETLMRPKLFHFQLPPRSIICQGPQPHALVKPVRDVAVHLGCNFAASSLGLSDARQRNEPIRYSRISSA